MGRHRPRQNSRTVNEIIAKVATADPKVREALHRYVDAELEVHPAVAKAYHAKIDAAVTPRQPPNSGTIEE